MRVRSLLTLTLIALGVHTAGPTAAAAGARTPLGQKIDDVELTSVTGEKQPVLGSAGAHVVLFFRPDQHNFDGTLKQLAACQKELAGKPLRWVALVPERYSPEEAKAAAEAVGLQMPVLLDVGDAMLGVFGVSMHPTVAILDKDHKLSEFQPYTKLNFCERVMAGIKHTLGELDDQGLQQGLDPGADQQKGAASASKRDIKLAEMLLKVNNVEKALESANKAVANDPKSAAAQAMVGRVLAVKKDCAGALSAFEAALKLDPAFAPALEGKKQCGKR
jgi:tetratricopeptide (TPR) repeat protein